MMNHKIILHQTDDIEVMVKGKRESALKKKPDSKAFLQHLRQYRGKLPHDFVFNRKDANTR